MTVQPLRRRWLPFAAAATAAAITSGAVLSAGGGPAGAASAPQAQSVGNFLDATLNNQPIDQLAELKYATARAPGSQSVQNPLDVTALGQLDLPLSGKLQVQKVAGVDLGAVNQVAVAHPDGSSYGGAGAVANSGGISIGGNNNAYPDSAAIDLCPSALSNGACGSDALGELKLGVGAVAAVASTPKGVGSAGSTGYRIAGLNLTLSSPMLGQLLGQLQQQLDQKSLTSVLTQLLGSTALPGGCSFGDALLPAKLDLGSGVTISATSGTITIDIQALLDHLGFDINKQPANTDLMAKLLDYLTSVDGLTKGVENVIDSAVGGLEKQFQACAAAVPGLPDALKQLNGARSQFEGAVNDLVGSLSGFGGTGNPLAPIGQALKRVVDIGVNVQPNGPSGSFTSALAATPKQGTPVVAHQTIVRAIEIDLVGDPLAVVALANAAAGPSAAAPVEAASAPPAPAAAVPADAVPTGVPAGHGVRNGIPVLPIVLLGLGLLFAAGGLTTLRYRLTPPKG